MLSVWLIILFWLCLAGLLHTYVLYPYIMCRLANKTTPVTPQQYHEDDSDLPFVTVLMAAYNEEKVLPAKLANLVAIAYGSRNGNGQSLKFRVLIGSDASTDATNALLTEFQSKYPEWVGVRNFRQRRGKPPIINELAAIATEMQPTGPNHLFLMTDASVMLEPDTVYRLARHFKNPRIGVVDAHMLSRENSEKGIGGSESTYMDRETKLKQCESRTWRMMIGPFGGCYMLRSDLFTTIPPRSLVDDFFLAFRALEQGYEAVNDLTALAYERPSHLISEEYRRKRRIAAGSLKNLSIFKRHILPPTSRLGFAFFSHKVLRWFGPWLMLGMWITSGILAMNSTVWLLVWLIGTGFCALISIVYGIFVLTGVRMRVIYHLFYFIAMNIALLHGFYVYLRGIKSDIWQPTKRV